MWNLESTFRGSRKLETRTAESLSKLNLNFNGSIYIYDDTEGFSIADALFQKDLI